MKIVSVRLFFIFVTIAVGTGCVVIPRSYGHLNECEISSDRKTLRVINVAKETNTYYSVSGLVLTPILVPATALVSGAYVAVNNIYNLGEEKIKCDSNKT